MQGPSFGPAPEPSVTQKAPASPSVVRRAIVLMGVAALSMLIVVVTGLLVLAAQD
jgi:hypothetical protein